MINCGGTSTTPYAITTCTETNLSFRARRKRKEDKLHTSALSSNRNWTPDWRWNYRAPECKEGPCYLKCLGSFSLTLSHHIDRSLVTSQTRAMHMFKGLYLTADNVAFLLSLGCFPSKKRQDRMFVLTACLKFSITTCHNMSKQIRSCSH